MQGPPVSWRSPLFCHRRHSVRIEKVQRATKRFLSYLAHDNISSTLFPISHTLLHHHESLPQLTGRSKISILTPIHFLHIQSTRDGLSRTAAKDAVPLRWPLRPSSFGHLTRRMVCPVPSRPTNRRLTNPGSPTVATLATRSPLTA